MDWTRGHTIGHGSTAAVSVAMSCFSGEIFAVKSTELSQSQFLQKEQNILSTLNSPYVVGYKGYDITRENNKAMFNLLMEYMSDGTLTDKIRRHGGRLNEPLIGYYTKQIAQGLEYLHSNDIVHCDIKGNNILLCKTGAKIADFGCARLVDPAEWGTGTISASTVPIGGTPMFMAPEVARGEEQKFPADLWSLGCTIIEMATGGSPWNIVSSPASLLYHIAFSSRTPEIPKVLSPQASDFLSKCLTGDPQHRWSAKQLLKHPFLQASYPNCEANQDFITSSPTSILDRGIWNSETMNESIQTSSSMDSPANCTNMKDQDTRTSILDQAIWNSVEESETIDYSSQSISSTDSPLQRVGKMVMQSRKADWKLEESWIIVRQKSEDNKVGDGKIIPGKAAFPTSCNCQNNILCCSIFCRMQQFKF